MQPQQPHDSLPSLPVLAATSEFMTTSATKYMVMAPDQREGFISHITPLNKANARVPNAAAHSVTSCEKDGS